MIYELDELIIALMCSSPIVATSCDLYVNLTKTHFIGLTDISGTF